MTQCPVEGSSPFELDHLFLIVPGWHVAKAMMKEAGLRVNYERVHPGQGTRNLCACLDDIFLELLWSDGSDVSDATEQITLGARMRGEGAPIGISWRGLSAFEQCPGGTVDYAAPFMPPDRTIPVAAQSLDLSMPFIFKTPGGVAPIDRVDGLVGERQSTELSTLGTCDISLPNSDVVGPVLAPFHNISVSSGDPAMDVTLLRSDGSVGRRFQWRGIFD